VALQDVVVFSVAEVRHNTLALNLLLDMLQLSERIFGRAKFADWILNLDYITECR